MNETQNPRRYDAIVLAAGAGRRLGEDKALVDLDGVAAVIRIVDDCRRAGVVHTVVIRQRGAAPLPDAVTAAAATPAASTAMLSVDTEQMIDSLRAGIAAVSPDAAGVLVWPIDYPLAGAGVAAALLDRHGARAPAAAIVLPLCAERPGHPILLDRSILGEVTAPATRSLREVIRRSSARVAVVPVENPWVLRDIDTPADLHAARGFLERRKVSVPELMRRHRSRRRYRPDDVGDAQIRWLVDSARHAPTSSFIQAYSVVVVRDPDRKARIAELCADQDHIRTAPVFLAICADLHKVRRSCERHGRSLNASSLEVFVEATVDAALLGQNLQLAAESEGLGSCMIGAARNHPTELAALLGLPRHAYTVFGMTLGWPADDPVPRGRMALDAVLHDERYAAGGIDEHLDAADRAMRAWARRSNEQEPDAPRKINEQRGWTDRMAWLFGRSHAPKGREHLARHLRELGFGFDGGDGDGDGSGDGPSNPERGTSPGSERE